MGESNISLAAISVFKKSFIPNAFRDCCKCISCCEISSQQLHLYLSWADAVSHDCTAHAQRFLHSLSRISRSLVLHLGVELGSDQDHDDRKPDPDHEADSGT